MDHSGVTPAVETRIEGEKLQYSEGHPNPKGEFSVFASERFTKQNVFTDPEKSSGKVGRVSLLSHLFGKSLLDKCDRLYF